MAKHYQNAYHDTQIDDARVVTYCAECYAPICEGYEFLRIGGEDYCPSCVRQHWMIAEADDSVPDWIEDDYDE